MENSTTTRPGDDGEGGIGEQHRSSSLSSATDPLLNKSEEEEKEAESGAAAMPTVVVMSTLVAVCGSYVFGSAVGYSSPAESGIIADLGLSVAEYSLFGSILTIGAMAGAIASGRLADIMGRRGTMAVAEFLSLVGWLSIAFAKVSWLLDIGRFAVGLGVGLLSYVVPVYIAEITPKNLRGGFTALHQLMICCGGSLMYLIGTIVLWRILAIVGTIPSLVQLLGLPFIPESPRWLAKNGRWHDSENALKRLRGRNADIQDEAAEIREYTEILQRQSKARLLDLFQRRYALSLIVGVGLMVLQQFGGVNGIAFYASSIFESAGFSGRVGTVSMVIVQVPMTALGTILTDRSGRRPLLLRFNYYTVQEFWLLRIAQQGANEVKILLQVSAAGTFLGCFLAGLSFLLQDFDTWDKGTPFMALAGVLIFPINMKGSAGSLVTVINWLGSWIVSYTFNFLMSWSSAGTFFQYSVVCGLTVLFVAKIVPETKGRTLEEIQASMNPFSSSQ
ncbi:Sugar transporter ERD6-like 5-like protein [Drosera capensis]